MTTCCGLLACTAFYFRQPDPNFSSYPRTAPFEYYLRHHSNSPSRSQQADLLAISAFPDNDGYSIEYLVNESGQEWDCRNVFSHAIQASQQKQLTALQLQALRSALRRLPRKSMTPPLERLVIVSFQDGANWVTRTYDSDALPRPMRQIYDIVGERFETKNKQKN